jgi:positive regulator of sigma E activity
MRRRFAEWALLVSLVAVLVWLAGLVLVSPLRDNLSANDLIVAIVVTALTWTIYWFARHSRQRGWLR